MEEETYTREPTSGDRLRRYNSKTMSLLRRRETGKADLPLARIEKQVCVCRELCAYVCAYRHLIVNRLYKTGPQETCTKDTESGLCVQ